MLDRSGSHTVFEGFETIQTGSLLGGTGTASSFGPFQLHAQHTFSFAFTGQLHFFPLCFHFQKSLITGGIAVKTAVVNFQNTISDTIQKIPVMGNHDHYAAESSKILLQPYHHLIIQMVGRLIQDQHIRRVDHGSGQRHSLFLTAGQMGYIFIVIGKSQAV